MEKSRKELIDKLLKELGKLPPNEQKAIVFIINNFSIIKKMCENSGRQYNQVTMLPIAENLSVYIVSSFEIRQYSCTPRLHKRKNFLAMGQRFCKKTALFRGAARRAKNTVGL